ncbi:MAG: putative CRISPR-associated protein [Zoogloeaceae bacterium]|jgi:putative CRISPR-associated protein (TIGR02619 family)|nr:putative CRISPR-associated protein [Zoogloeaceae bacterium]
MNLLLSTCGTSILTNSADEGLRALLNRHANIKTGDDVPTAECKRIREHIENRKNAFVAHALEAAKCDSAELNGILSFYDNQLTPENRRDIHYLLATDTWFGEETAGIVKAWLVNHGFTDIRVERCPDLQTADWQLFSSALSDLVKWCAETIAPQRTSHCRVIFNLSGGFKSETGFLQVLGMFYADETVYMFERSNELMRIPRLPVVMVDEEAVRDDLRDFRRAAQGLEVRTEKSGIYWFALEGKHALTPWGELVFGQHKDEIYQREIHPSPSEKIIFAPGFPASCENETPRHKQEINQKIDLLARFLEDANHPNPNSLHYHPVTHPRDGEVTYEIYAWSDHGAKRIYGRSLDDGKVELRFLGEHL